MNTGVVAAIRSRETGDAVERREGTSSSTRGDGILDVAPVDGQHVHASVRACQNGALSVSR